MFEVTLSPSGGYAESVIWNFQPGQGVASVSVVLDASGNLYGVTQNTNAVNNTAGGAVFKLSPGPSGYTLRRCTRSRVAATVHGRSARSD